MEVAYAERFANGAARLDECARIILSCLLKSGDFSGLQDIAGVNVSPADGKEFAIDADISHMKVCGELRHAFVADDSDQFLRGALDLQVLDERGRSQGDVLVQMIHDGQGNYGWRGDPSVLHSVVPPGVPEGRRFRQQVLQLLRLKAYELLEAHPLQAIWAFRQHQQSPQVAPTSLSPFWSIQPLPHSRRAVIAVPCWC